MEKEKIIAISLKEKNITLEKFLKEDLKIEKEFLKKAKEIIKDCERSGIKILTIFDNQYPEELKRCPLPPLVIYMKGKISTLKKRKIGIIGTRKPTKYGREVALEFSKKLSEKGVVIVSGGARGIDTIAHLGAIEAGGETICIFGSGLNVFYPPENIKIFKKIEENGSLISEYPPDTKPFAYNFPMRNRIIAALSEALLIVEAGEKSGTFITVKWALDMGKEIFAIPGEIYSPKSRGPNFLIKQGAILVTDPSEILEYLGIEEKSEKEEIKLEGKEKKIFEFLKENGRKSIDEIREKIKIETGELISILINLEIKGIIRNEGSGFYSIK
ncbi:MAG: DNA-processing protein DprA [candidate division WOR-3 bacterium]